jgi:hypothetical protein
VSAIVDCWPIGDVIAVCVGAFCFGGLVVLVILAYSGRRRGR